MNHTFRFAIITVVTISSIFAASALQTSALAKSSEAEKGRTAESYCVLRRLNCLIFFQKPY